MNLSRQFFVLAALLFSLTLSVIHLVQQPTGAKVFYLSCY